MSKKDYVERLWCMRKEIANDIMRIIESNGGEIKIPFFYDEDEITDEIETLIEDNFDVRVGDVYENMFATTLNYCGYKKDVYIVHFYINDKTKQVEFVSSDSNIYEITDIENIQTLALIYEKLAKDYGNE